MTFTVKELYFRIVFGTCLLFLVHFCNGTNLDLKYSSSFLRGFHLQKQQLIQRKEKNDFLQKKNLRLFTTQLKFDSPLQITDDRFLSVTLDTSIIRHHWAYFDTSSVKLKTLAKGLSPVYLRLGGTSCDFLVFRDTEEPEKKLYFLSNNDTIDWDDLEKPDTTDFNMTMFDWMYINKFVNSIPDWLLIFDLNVLQRTNNRWDPSINASSLLVQSAEKGFCLAGLELGNEPDAFRHWLQYSIDPTILGKDFRHLSKIKSLVPCMGESLVVGPDVTAETMRKREHAQFLRDFLLEAHDSLDAITIHHYYVNGRTATAAQFMDPDVLDSLRTELDVALNILQDTNSKKPLWLGETSSAFGGGAPGLSDSFIAGFMWLDKLGVSAEKGVQVVMRQSFYKGHYALIDSKTLDPRPDYWLSFLFKRLVGNNVLETNTDDPERKLRMYAHCTQIKGNSQYNNESVTVYGMNLYDENVQLKLSQFVENQETHVYLLEPDGKEGLFSGKVRLNGKLLKLLNGNRRFPSIKPCIQHSNLITIPPHRLVFIVVPNVEAPACKIATAARSPGITKESLNTKNEIKTNSKDFLEFLKYLFLRFLKIFI